MTLKSTYMDHRNGGSSAWPRCEQMCRDDPQCHSYMGRSSGNTCYLSKDKELKEHGPDCCSGHHAYTLNEANCDECADAERVLDHFTRICPDESAKWPPAPPALLSCKASIPASVSNSNAFAIRWTADLNEQPTADIYLIQYLKQGRYAWVTNPEGKLSAWTQAEDVVIKAKGAALTDDKRDNGWSIVGQKRHWHAPKPTAAGRVSLRIDMCPPNGFYTYDEATGELIDFRRFPWAISDYMRDVRPPPEGTGSTGWTRSCAWLVPPPPPLPPDAEMCSLGIQPIDVPSDVCCAKSCVECGGSHCSRRPGGTDSCCLGRIREAGRYCEHAGDTACIIPKPSPPPSSPPPDLPPTPWPDACSNLTLDTLTCEAGGTLTRPSGSPTDYGTMSMTKHEISSISMVGSDPKRGRPHYHARVGLSSSGAAGQKSSGIKFGAGLFPRGRLVSIGFDGGLKTVPEVKWKNGDSIKVDVDIDGAVHLSFNEKVIRTIAKGTVKPEGWFGLVGVYAPDSSVEKVKVEPVEDAARKKREEEDRKREEESRREKEERRKKEEDQEEERGREEERTRKEDERRRREEEAEMKHIEDERRRREEQERQRQLEEQKRREEEARVKAEIEARRRAEEAKRRAAVKESLDGAAAKAHHNNQAEEEAEAEYAADFREYEQSSQETYIRPEKGHARKATLTQALLALRADG